MRRILFTAAAVAALITALLLTGCFGGSAPRPVAPEITTDGSGGTIIVWSAEKGARVQRIDSQSNCLWGSEGRQIYSYSKHPVGSLAAGDDNGGAILAWTDEYPTSEDIPQWGVYAQRLDSQGNATWPEGGISVTAGPFDVNHGQVEMINESLIDLIKDGSSGAILLWYNEIQTDNSWKTTVHAQRVGADGDCLWGERGIQICDTAPDPRWAKLVSDGSGGIIILWEDTRSQDMKIYAQRISFDGRMLWPDSGIPVASGSGAQLQPQIIDDAMGNFIIAWMESSHPQYDIGENRIYAQKIDVNGKPLWTQRGIPLDIAPGNKSHFSLASDGSGGCIAVWHDARNRPYSDVYAQRVSSTGETLWETDGLLVWDISGAAESPQQARSRDAQIVGDRAGGAIVTWQTQPDDSFVTRIYAQRLGSNGELLWTETGVDVYENPSLKSQGYSSVVSDGMGGVIITSKVGKGRWPDLVYTQRIDPSGNRLWGAEGIRINS